MKVLNKPANSNDNASPNEGVETLSVRDSGTESEGEVARQLLLKQHWA